MEAHLTQVQNQSKPVPHQDSPNSLELGKKCISYRSTIMELVHDNNYFRLLLCSMLNAHHNITNGKQLNALDADHPYRTTLIKFTPVPNKKTGLYIGYKGDALRREDTLNKAYRVNPYYPNKVPVSFDPFLKDHYVFSGAIPGLSMPRYKNSKNPFNICAKQPSPIKNPESLFGPQIEDFAAQARLKSWRLSGNAHAATPEPKASPEDPTAIASQRTQLYKYVTEINLGPISFNSYIHFAPYKMLRREDASA
ncbi:hypothetical protein COCC4DRAFT_158059 [Bipolaris maydis ATCC 48331]|uniref:Uncharacterized protein n=2 Tax=Cochliobolus heterostrophus TaxID=5016 RepID=M2U8D2_COCH5|nr:uncharacterized protein COCC4DRAFT_158059 [Bipolaris maydis ATCC 48331]EMD90026.1 hypothetical protein COCHEDRAFT_1225588 [Bipolaris maydis C5]KAJ5025302.1 hypothetical protein J3E73DRAFT_382426 [Bipolaris maydis]ENI09760.1 hypothetical protein COCC4DRAFT_158059 [Bipolaris maydis ATCC 48331]KAJ5063892.1 hypothetical protein J3E74DRAFT_415037 [Bipolaris maydis]KAJ6196957.1 hypothetical protein J3E72DRAFT_386339 [Bipolaris maydis]